MAAGLLDGDRIHKSMFYHLRIKSREDVKFCKDLDLCMTVVPVGAVTMLYLDSSIFSGEQNEKDERNF